jgi:hypothetical protein
MVSKSKDWGWQWDDMDETEVLEPKSLEWGVMRVDGEENWGVMVVRFEDGKLVIPLIRADADVKNERDVAMELCGIFERMVVEVRQWIVSL